MSNPSKKPSTVLSLTDLDNAYNPNVIVPAKIKAALAKLGDHAMTSVNFHKEAGITLLQLSQFGEEFEEFQVVIRENGKPKTLWCGTKAFALKVKERLGV